MRLLCASAGITVPYGKGLLRAPSSYFGNPHFSNLLSYGALLLCRTSYLVMENKLLDYGC